MCALRRLREGLPHRRADIRRGESAIAKSRQTASLKTRPVISYGNVLVVFLLPLGVLSNLLEAVH
jgi:hypothetical protein